ncbi:MAG: RagB/SusD family nutrient uptake outer membrane protein [Bacteroidetes bacterium]|jgi:hypothetical protein|nr:RagB/SusD family nutrient uptake outer membrane protein [Bacteroidota bacterium]
MKKLILLFIGLIAIISCDNFLAEVPEDQIALNQFFDSPEDARSAVNAVYRVGAADFYDTSENANGGGSDAMMGGYMSGFFDSDLKGVRIFPRDAQILDLDSNRWSDYLGEWWTSCYDAISRANTAIKNIPNTEGLSDSEMNHLLAEVRFLRAFSYFYLVKNFGDVPVITEPYESLDNINVERKGESEVYNQIITDLNWALNQGGLSDTPFTMNDFTITEGAVATLLADVHLHMAGYPLQAEENYSEAANAARQVINNGQYELIEHGPTLEESAYNVMRTSDVEREYIYSIEYDSNIEPNQAPKLIYPEDVRPPGIKYTRTTGAYGPIDEFIWAYDPNVDLRIQNQQFFFDSIDVAGETFEFEMQPYLWHDDQALYETGRGGQDMRVYRYAELLLIAAEAIARSEGVTDEAISYLADVRDRAYWNTDRSQIVASLNGLSEQQFVEEVWTERLRELALDAKIWFDIQRTRKYPITDENNKGEVNFVDVIGATNPWGHTFEEHHLLYPIPDREMQRNPELEQNPGY